MAGRSKQIGRSTDSTNFRRSMQIKHQVLKTREGSSQSVERV